MTEHPYQIHEPEQPSRWVVTCDHASNHVPDWVGGGDLGLPAADMDRHIAYDIGAAGVSVALAAALGGSAILSHFSRLVIDPNRGEHDPTLLMRLYDGTIIPANRHADAAETERRLERLHRPYHKALSGLVSRRDDTVYCAVHSFTPQLRARPPRPWEIGVLYADGDDRLAQPLITALTAQGLCVGDNEPYKGHLPGDSVHQHALRQGRPNILIELRNDLIADAAGQALWAARLAPILEQTLADSGLKQERHPMDDQTRIEIEAAAFRRLQQHMMQDRPDAQNIDMMNLAGFCRNCLSRWYQEAAHERGVEMTKDEGREAFYGMPFAEWKAKHQTEASPDASAAFTASHPKG